MLPSADETQADADAPARRFATLQTLIADLGHDLTLAEAADIITREVMTALGAGLVLLCRLSDDGSRYQIVRALGIEQAEAGAWAEFPVVAHVPIADAVRARQPLYLQSWQEREARYPQSGQVPTPERGGALAAIPLLVVDRAVGGLGLILPEGRAFGEGDQDFLRAVGQLSADALDRARRHELRQVTQSQDIASRDHPDPAAPEHYRILIVDDNPEDRAVLVRAFRNDSPAAPLVDLREVDTLAAALDALRREEFACVFLDHSLPDGTSLDLLVEARTQGWTVPLIVMTGPQDEELVAEVMKAGAVDYLPKQRLRPETVVRSLHAALLVHQARREKQAVLDELHLRDRAIATAASGIVIADPRLPDCPLVYVNEAFLQMTGYTEQEVLGRNCRFLQGPDTDPEAVRALREAVQEERPCQVLLLNYRKNGTPFWNDVAFSPVRGADGVVTRIIGVQSDVTEIKRIQEEACRLSAELGKKVSEFQTLFDLLPVAVLVADDPACASIRANPAGERLLAVPPRENISMSAPEEKTGAFRVMRDGRDVPPNELPMQVAAATGEVVNGSECLIVRSDGSEAILYGYSAPLFADDGKTRGSIGAFIDVTPLKRLETELQVHAEWLRQGEAYLRAVVEALAEGVIVQDMDGVLTSANGAAERLLGLSVEEMTGRVSTDPRWGAVRDDSTDFPAEEHPGVVALRTGQPVRDVMMGLSRPDDTQVWLSVNSQPIFDSDTGKPLGVVSSFFDITLQREAQRKAQARTEREMLLNRIGQAMRSSSDPDTIQAETLTLLGEALAADRCHFAFYDLVGGTVAVIRDWHRAGLPSNQGIYTFPNTAEMFHELHPDSTPSVIEDAHTATITEQTRANMERLGLRSRLAVALTDSQEIMATLTVSMADAPRAWTSEEVALVEAVAPPLRLAVEKANIARREHKIAEQLQAALQPATPATIPGMEIAAYYRPAWEDEGVGGDFSDVFRSEKDVTFLVVGDVSGKGLSAASEVATVRQMLRFALLNGRTVEGPVTTLNRTLAEHELLTGFATLFVGRYDAASRSLTYVNCGQDAGLVLRANSGNVEPLPPTGPVLGAFSNAGYREETVRLDTGDVLALYTDGLTEAGPSRTALLTGDGVADLLQKQAGQSSAPEIMSRLIAGVEAYAKAGVRDDQCVIIGVVSKS